MPPPTHTHTGAAEQDGRVNSTVDPDTAARLLNLKVCAGGKVCGPPWRAGHQHATAFAVVCSVRVRALRMPWHARRALWGLADLHQKAICDAAALSPAHVCRAGEGGTTPGWPSPRGRRRSTSTSTCSSTLSGTQVRGAWAGGALRLPAMGAVDRKGG